MSMQTLVTAHAAFGHNHFFKNNYLFKQWTDADAILNYMEFAKGYIALSAQEKYGLAAVEPIIDARLTHSWNRRCSGTAGPSA